MMQLGAEGVFVGSGIFKSGEGLPEAEKLATQRAMASAIVKAVTHFNDPHVIAEVSAEIIGEPMRGQSVAQMAPEQLLAGRGN
jgi:pyridoxal 5'-phosphate synthase pdxS subunit